MKKMKLHTPNLTEINIDRIREIFPNCVTEADDEKGQLRLAVDFNQLRQELSDHIVEGPQESYHLNWPGKRQALLMANAPIAKTLRPCREESVDFDTTENLFIEGDNLDALKLLRETYLGKIKMIYIDPPYNTGKDFVYKDKFAGSAKEYLLESNQKDEDGNHLVDNLESNGRFHSDWLSMMYPRLRVCKKLLSDDGAICVSIGDRELSNLLQIMSEVFGEKSQIGIFTWKSRAKPTNAGNARFRTQRVAEYVVVYGKRPADQIILNVVSAKVRTYPHEDEYGRYRTTTILTSNLGMFRRETMRFEAGGFSPDEDVRWKAGKAKIDKLFSKNRIIFNDEGIPVEKKYKHEEKDPLYPIYSFVDPDISGTAEQGKSDLNELIGKQHGLDTVKPVLLMKYLISTFSGDGDVVLDIFAGSGTTGQALQEIKFESGLSQKYILVQFPEPIENGEFQTISDIAKARLRASGNCLNHLQGVEEVQPLDDIGFRVLKIDSSNMADVYYAPDSIEQEDLLAAVDNIKPGRDNPEDLLFQVMLDWGVDLTLPIRKEIIQDKTVLFVDGNALIACFDTGITEDLVKELAGNKPHRVVFRDNGFASDAVKINVDQIFRQLSPTTEVKSI